MTKIEDLTGLVFDLESTGLDVDEARIVEFGVAVFRGREHAGGGRLLLNPGVPIPAESTEVHGIDDRRVAGCPSLADNSLRLMTKFDEAQLIVGYNCLHYDVPLFDAEIRRLGLDWQISRDKVLDVKMFVDWHHRNERPRTQEVIGKLYGLSFEGRAHSAGVDAQMTGDLLWAMIDDKKIPGDLDKALEAQRMIDDQVTREFDIWDYWFYQDRENGRLRMGAGKYCGYLLTEVPKSYWSVILRKARDDMTPASLKIFEDAAAGRLDTEFQETLVPAPETVEPEDLDWGGW